MVKWRLRKSLIKKTLIFKKVLIFYNQATWAGYMCTDFCLKDLDIWENFVSLRITEALELDSLISSHPIEVQVGPPSEINEIFDDISYSKGASVLRMLKNFMGDDVRKIF